MIIYGIHLFKEGPYKSDREVWENNIHRLKSDGIKLEFISLNLSPILNSSDATAYLQEMNELQKQLKEKIFPGRIGRLRRKKKGHLRNMIIADGLATWMIRDLMYRNGDLFENTETLVFLGIPKPIIGDIDISSTSATSVTKARHPTAAYLDEAFSVFIDKEYQNSPTKLDWGDEVEYGLMRWLREVDCSFPNSAPANQLFCWQITSGDGRGTLKPQIGECVNDLLKLTQFTMEITRTESPATLSDAVSNRMRFWDDLEATNRLGRATHRFHLPESAKNQGFGHNGEAQLTCPGSETAKPTFQPRYDPPTEIADLRDKAIDCFYADSLKNADHLFAAFIESLEGWSNQSDETDFEVYFLHGVTCLQLGRYHQAKKRFEEALDRISHMKNLRREKFDFQFLDIELNLIYRYSTALMRVGYYDEARIHLEDLVQRANNDEMEKDETYRDRFLEVQINAHQKLSLIRNFQRNFESTDGDDDLISSLRMIQEYSSIFEEKHSQIEQKWETRSGMHLVEEKPTDPGNREDRLVRRIRIEPPDVLRNQHEMTVSQIWILQGNLSGAREKLQEVVRGFREHLGPNNLITLEATVTLAGLLVNTSNIAEGEQLVADSRERIVENLDVNHPLAVEATYVSIIACSAQGRDEEALQVSQHLCEYAERNNIFGRNPHDRKLHPRVSAYYTQLSSAHVAVGNYKEAEECLESSLFDHDDDDFDNKRILATIRATNLSHLAWAYLHLGKYSCAQKTLHQALKILLPWGDFSANSSSDPAPLARALLNTLEGQMVGSQPHFPGYIHPDTLFTLQVCSELESRQTDVDIQFVLDARDIVFRSLSTLFGKDSTETLRAQLLLGYAMNASGHAFQQMERLHDGSQQFRNVLQTCFKKPHLHKDHPLNLEAKREILLYDIMVDKFPKDQKQRSIKVLESIRAKQERSIGSYQTQTLLTCIWRLSAGAAALGLPPDQARRDLLKRLHYSKVREQRLVESLLMEERVSQIYSKAGKEDICQAILEDLLKSEESIKETEKDPEIASSCDEIFRRAEKSVKRTRPRIEALDVQVC